MCRKCNAEPKTLEEIDLLSHTVCGTCPGCKMEIVATCTAAEVKDKNKQMMKAAIGDPEPKSGPAFNSLKNCKDTWLLAHYGIKYGHNPLIRVPVKKWPVCLLHFDLRVKSGMLNRNIFNYLGDYGDAEVQQQ
jgi:hypothetical protein